MTARGNVETMIRATIVPTPRKLVKGKIEPRIPTLLEVDGMNLLVDWKRIPYIERSDHGGAGM